MWQKKKDHCVFTLKHTNTHAKGIYPRPTRYNKDTSSLMICTEMQSERDTIKALKKKLRPECSRRCLAKMCCYTTQATAQRTFPIPASTQHPICKPSSPLDYPAWLTSFLLVIMNKCQVPALWKGRKKDVTFYWVMMHFADKSLYYDDRVLLSMC